MQHEKNTPDDAVMFDRLFPEKRGERFFSPVQRRRADKLGITASTPNGMSPEERSRFVRLNIDPATITWNRVVDINDRALRGVVTGQVH